MKCPKCDYLGFETGDRCKNCGYDFSLLAAPVVEPDLALTLAGDADAPVGEIWIDRGTEAAHDAGPLEAFQHDPEPSFPLFVPAGGDDEPLVKLPAEPRAPLAVRRAPDHARGRAASRPPRTPEPELALEFDDVPVHEPVPPTPSPRPPRPAVRQDAVRVDEGAVAASLGRRALAAAIDHGILLSIDLMVVYSTLRMTSLTMDDWRALPAMPMLIFLVMMKLGYFSAFTAMGGQTIGKMAAGIRVVADEPLTLDPARAIQRTLTSAVSLLSFGLGLIPAFVSPERRAFHDRVSHTRVVALPSA